MKEPVIGIMEDGMITFAHGWLIVIVFALAILLLIAALAKFSYNHGLKVATRKVDKLTEQARQIEQDKEAQIIQMELDAYETIWRMNEAAGQNWRNL